MWSRWSHALICQNRQQSEISERLKVYDLYLQLVTNIYCLNCYCHDSGSGWNQSSLLKSSFPVRWLKLFSASEICDHVICRVSLQGVEYCQVMFDYKATAADELELKKGDVVAILNKVWMLCPFPRRMSLTVYLQSPFPCNVAFLYGSCCVYHHLSCWTGKTSFLSLKEIKMPSSHPGGGQACDETKNFSYRNQINQNKTIPSLLL